MPGVKSLQENEDTEVHWGAEMFERQRKRGVRDSRTTLGMQIDLPDRRRREGEHLLLEHCRLHMILKLLH